METESNYDFVRIIKQWSLSNDIFCKIKNIEELDQEMYKITLQFNDFSLNFYTNEDMNYFFLENLDDSQIEEQLIAEINYFIFNKNERTIIDVLNEINNKLIIGAYSSINSTSSEEDEFNTGYDEYSDELIKSRWSKIDKELRKKNSKNVNYFNIPKNLIYSPNIIFNIVSNEILKMNSIRNLNYKIVVDDDNIYNIKIRMYYPKESILSTQLKEIKTKFGYDFIEIELGINMNLYPFYPPSVNLLRPKINNSLVYSIMDMEFLKFENWNPTNTLQFVIETLYTIFENHAKIQTDTDLNKLSKSYIPIEYALMNMSTKYKINSQKHEQIDVEYVKISNQSDISKKSDNKIWKSGTGYGHTGRKEWDINAYIRDQERIDLEMSVDIDAICDLIQNFDSDKNELINIIEPSCLFTLIKNRMMGGSLMEIDKNKHIYTSIVKLSSLIISDKIWSKDSSLHLFKNSFENISSECKSFIEHFKEEETPIIILYKMINNIGDQLNTIESEEDKKPAASSNEDEYVKNLKPYLFDSMDITNGSFKYKDILAKTQMNKKSLMRLVKEISSIQNALPLSFSSSVFFRTDTESINAIKFIITGPRDTPYESGCFEFDAVFKSDYPEGPPTVNLITTGGGKVRFNPNLYNCGKVCLSLLGTWSGQKGESWNKDASTFLQVLISIQSLIFVDDPYFNEPGWERQMGTSQGDKKTFEYNDNIRLQNLRWAILDKLKNPTVGFEEAIKNHFYYKKDKIIETLHKWHSEALKKSDFEGYMNETIELLNKIKIN